MWPDDFLSIVLQIIVYILNISEYNMHIFSTGTKIMMTREQYLLVRRLIYCN